MKTPTDLLVFGDLPGDEVETLAVDTETTGLSWEDSDLLGVSFAWRDGETIRSGYLAVPQDLALDLFVSPGSVVPTDYLANLLKRATKLVFFNHAFDYRYMLKTLGIEPLDNVIDVQHVSKHLGPQEELSLVALYTKYVGPPKETTLAMKSKRSKMGEMSVGVVSEYARDDAVMTLELLEQIRHLAWESPYLGLHLWDQSFMHLVMQMVQRGLPVDRTFCETRISEFRRRMVILTQELYRSSGIHNPGSPDDVYKYLQRKGIPAPDTKEETLLGLDVDDPALPAIIEYRQLSKSISSWLDPLLKLSAQDGRLHSELHPFGTRSFRMSSKDLNAQGIPMDPDSKRYGGSMFGVFKSTTPGLSLWALDLKQAEVRLAAILSGDERLQTTMASGDDPYTALAVAMWKDASKRSMAKRALLSAIYEVGTNTFSMRYKVSLQEAQTTLNLYRSMFPQMRRHSINQAAVAERSRKIDLCTGRPRYFFNEPSYEAFNQEVQGSLAEVMREWMLRVEKEYPDRLVLQVHDSLIVYLPDDGALREQMVVRMGELVQSCTEDLIPTYKSKPTVRMLLDAKPYQL